MANENIIIIDEKEHLVPDGGLTASDILVHAGLDPDSGHVVIRTDGGRAVIVHPGDVLNVDDVERASFKTFRNGDLHHLKLEGETWDWGAPAIQESTIRRIASVPDDSDIRIGGGTGGALRRGSVVDLTTASIPQLMVEAPRPEPERMQIIVNGRSREIEGPVTTFENLVGLAFPAVTDLTNRNQSLTVVYRRGPAERPEGSVVAHQAVRLQRGAVVNVTATSKS